LGDLYKKIPDTTGCIENINSGKSCNSWCCKNQSPQVLYCEFLSAWNFILKNWEFEDILTIIERSLKNYLNDSPTKGCIFRNYDTKLCNIHKKRCFNCRIYAITPDSEFNDRLARLRELYKDNEKVFFREQCDLVKTVNDEKVEDEDTDKWWEELCKIEKIIGVKKELITDNPEGTYRTYHDHILIYLLPEYLLENLSHVRKFGNEEEKENITITFMNMLSSAIQGFKNGKKDKNS